MYKKIVLFNSILLSIIAVILVQYYTSRPQKIHFPQQQWQDDFSPQFFFSVKDCKKKYRLSLFLTYNKKYGFQNLYMQYGIQKGEKNITSAIHETQLFHSISGKPLGKGLFKKKTKTILLLDNYQFPEQGEYTLFLQQFMRKKILKGLVKIQLDIQALS